jgi:hypothetical protein
MMVENRNETVDNVEAGYCSDQATDEISMAESQTENSTSGGVRPGAIQKLVVPREDIGEDIAESEELNPADSQIKIRKPKRREWIVIKRDSELPTRLLVHETKDDTMEKQHYFVAPELRQAIRQEMRDVRVFLYYAANSQTFGLWVVNVNLDNSWYESLQELFVQPVSFFEENEIRVFSDKASNRYKIKFRESATNVDWPKKPTEELLGEALGDDRFIVEPDHTVYHDLVAGEEL